MANKYGNRKPVYKGVKFDSSLEMCRYIYLEGEERKGKITDLCRQVKFVLIPAQRDGNGKLLERECYYLADFMYTYKGKVVVEDAKGVRTDVYKLKKKMMLYFHHIRIVEVTHAAAPIGK